MRYYQIKKKLNYNSLYRFLTKMRKQVNKF